MNVVEIPFKNAENGWFAKPLPLILFSSSFLLLKTEIALIGAL